MKISAIVVLDDNTLLVDERTDLLAKVFVAELSDATSILGTWDCVGATTSSSFLGGVSVPVCPTTAQNPQHKSIEQMSAAELQANEVVAIASPASKQLIVALDSRAGMPQKIEGISVVNRVELAIANDNDFNVLAGGNGTAFDTSTGNMILRSPAAPNQILRIKLESPLPTEG